MRVDSRPMRSGEAYIKPLVARSMGCAVCAGYWPTGLKSGHIAIVKARREGAEDVSASLKQYGTDSCSPSKARIECLMAPTLALTPKKTDQTISKMFCIKPIYMAQHEAKSIQPPSPCSRKSEMYISKKQIEPPTPSKAMEWGIFSHSLSPR